MVAVLEVEMMAQIARFGRGPCAAGEACQGLEEGYAHHKKVVSGKCDICNESASTAKGSKVFTDREMQQATKRGFNAYASGDAARMLALGGFGKDEMPALWKQDMMRSTTAVSRRSVDTYNRDAEYCVEWDNRIKK